MQDAPSLLPIKSRGGAAAAAATSTTSEAHERVKLTTELCEACYVRESALHTAGRPVFFMHPHPLSEFIPIEVELAADLTARAPPAASSALVPLSSGAAGLSISDSSGPLHRPIPSPRKPLQQGGMVEPPKQPHLASASQAALKTAPVAVISSGIAVPVSPAMIDAPQQQPALLTAPLSQRPGSAFTVPITLQNASTPHPVSAPDASPPPPLKLVTAVDGSSTSEAAVSSPATVTPGNALQDAATAVVHCSADTAAIIPNVPQQTAVASAAASANGHESRSLPPPPVAAGASSVGSGVQVAALATPAPVAAADGVMVDPDPTIHSPFFGTRQVCVELNLVFLSHLTDASLF
jgi:hypothetical protein